MTIECPIGYRIQNVRTKSKKGQIYTYQYLRKRKQRKEPKGKLVTSKYGRIYRLYYEKKYEFRDSLRSLRRSVKLRDNYTCQSCGKLGEKLFIHHKDFLGRHKCNSPNNNLDNLITLCPKCHMSLHYGVMEKHKNMKELRYEGLTFAEIGKAYGVSRQRIHQILTKNKCPTLQ